MKYFLIVLSIAFIFFSSCTFFLKKNNVRLILEVNTREVLVRMAGEKSTDPAFIEALNQADSLKKIMPGQRYPALFFKVLSSSKTVSPEVFVNSYTARFIPLTSTKPAILKAVEQELGAALDRTKEVLANRLSHADQSKPLVERIEGTDLIKVEINSSNSIQQKEILDLLTSQGKISFLYVYAPEEINTGFVKADAYLAEQQPAPKAIREESLSLDEETEITETIPPRDVNSPLVKLLKSNAYELRYNTHDTAHIYSLLTNPSVKSFFPKNMVFVWGIPSIINGDTLSELIAVKRDLNYSVLTGSSITSATTSVERDDIITINFTFNAEGSEQWKQMTRIASQSFHNKRIAILLDNSCLTAPTVVSEIPGGKSSISGNFTLEEAQAIATMMQSGACPAGLVVREIEVMK